jgi:hypothetical protein
MKCSSCCLNGIRHKRIDKDLSERTRRELDAMIPVLVATVTAAYGVWYGLFVKEFKAVHPWTGRTRYRHKPEPYLRPLVVAACLTILIAGVTELVRLWKSN